jgi:pyruvate dehydrogenase E2 component (dihydrolipoamide acetyltransferase)
VTNKRLPQIARESKDLIERAKGGALRVEEVTQGTFSITNLGPYGIETLIGIIQPPQTAILGVGTVMERPAVRDGEIVVRQMMKVALSADHRVTDGAQGAQFLGEIKGLLEAPVGLVL